MCPENVKEVLDFLLKFPNDPYIFIQSGAYQEAFLDRGVVYCCSTTFWPKRFLPDGASQLRPNVMEPVCGGFFYLISQQDMCRVR